MKIKPIYKRIGNYTGGIILALCCFFGTYEIYKKNSIKLSDLNKYSGIVIDKGIAKVKHSVAGKASYTSNVFYIKLNGLNQVLAAYNISGDYSWFDQEIKIGNNITVWYLKSSKPNQINMNTYKIESEQGLILSEESIRNNNRLGIWIGTIGGLLLLGLTFYNDSKYWKQNER